MSGAGRDTIVAVATPPGRGGVAILRISGPRAHAVAAARLAPGVRLPAAGSHQLAWLQDLDGSRLDQALILSFHAPHSYTGEDVVEFHIHGAPFVVNLLLNNLLRDCAAADPGEFTRRAVENGRMRLDQAEGVRALSEARSGLAHRLALRALAGGTGNLVESLRVELLDLLAELEADLDFSEHEICPAPPAQLLLSLEAMTRRITTWQASWHTGRLAAGAQVVLVGAPNAGKSTLLNALAGQERALVDEAPGTTRDAIAVEVRLDDELSITLWDTAGLREDAHGVEARGQFLTRQQLERADLILHLVAPDQQPMPELKDDPRVILLHSKGDLPRQLPLQDADWLVISASTGLGLAELRQCMRQRLLSDQWQQLELVISEARHLDLLVEARLALVRASQALVQRLDRSLVAADVRDAAHALGSISGAIDFDELYPRIFSRFCIGK